MVHMIATVLISLLKVCFMWAATILVVIPWTISQEHFIHFLGIAFLGGGTAVLSAVMTVKIYKSVSISLFPGKSA
jgi:hypothetical protein